MKLVLLTMQFCTRNVAAANGATLATGVVQATQHGSNVSNFTQQDQSSDHFATRDVQQCPWANNSQDGVPCAQDNTYSTDAARRPAVGDAGGRATVLRSLSRARSPTAVGLGAAGRVLGAVAVAGRGSRR